MGRKVTIKEAATITGLHPNTVRKRVVSGEWPSETVHDTRFGDTYLLDADTLPRPDDNPLQRAIIESETQEEPAQVATPPQLVITVDHDQVRAVMLPFLDDLAKTHERVGYLEQELERERHLRRRAEAQLAAQPSSRLWVWFSQRRVG